MKFYNDEFLKIRKEKKLKLIKLAATMGVNRNTLWLWTLGRVQPSEKKVRMLACALGVSVDKISDLQPEIPLDKEVDAERKKAISTWLSLADKNGLDRNSHNIFLLKELGEQLDWYRCVEKAASSLINSTDHILYVKDSSLRYVMASNSFLDMFSMKGKDIIGKTDADLFPEKEARINTEEDKNVICTRKTVKNREGIIPGSRKQKWGLISKIPMYDGHDKNLGIIGSFIDITKRKESEYVPNRLLHSVNQMDKGIWMGTGDLASDEQGNVVPQKILFVSNNSFTERFLLKGTDPLSKNQITYFNSLKLDKPHHDLRALRENGFSVVRYRVKIPETNEIESMKGTIFYDWRKDTYMGVIEKDEAANTVEAYRKSVLEKLHKFKVEEKIIKNIQAL